MVRMERVWLGWKGCGLDGKGVVRMERVWLGWKGCG